jgi:hypothetical protein
LDVGRKAGKAVKDEQYLLGAGSENVDASFKGAIAN